METQVVSIYAIHSSGHAAEVFFYFVKHSRDFNLTREAALSTTLAKETPAYDVQQACGTGLETAILVANKIALGQIDVGIAGGVDTASDAPIAVNERMRKILLEANRGKTPGQRVGALTKLRPAMLLAGLGWLTFAWSPLALALRAYVLPFGALAELVLMLWLILKGVDAPV